MKKRLLFLLLFLLLLYVLNAFLNPFPTKNVPVGFRPMYGASYNFEQAAWLGMDPKAQYIKLIDNYKFDWIRLSFFWDTMTSENGELKIDDLIFAIEEAEKRNIKVVVALGIKTPYHPEYHVPDRLLSKLEFGDTIDSDHPIAGDILEINKNIVTLLSEYKNIGWWQVENEPFLANINNWEIDKEFLKKEVEGVREVDPLKRPIILTTHGPHTFDRDWKNYFEILKPGDVFGVNAFFKVQGPHLLAFTVFNKDIRVPWPNNLSWPAQSWLLLSADYSAIKKYSEKQGVDTWVMELQAEPYIRVLEDANKQKFEFSAADIVKADRFMKQNRIESVGLWGSNFWLYRESIGDNSWMKSVVDILGSN